MRPVPVSEIAARCSAELVGDSDVLVGPDVVIDSRLVTPGSLFVAVVGERVDGHDFVLQSATSGAAAVLVGRRVPVDLPQVVVADQIAALSELARSVGAEADVQVVGITGSSGKTSTKDLIAQVLAADGKTVAPQGSRNNEIGVPLTALEITDDTKHLVIEMGARGAGHVEWLCSITPPQIGVVTNVGTAHVGEFGSVSGIAAAKSELVQAASEWAVLNADDPNVLGMRELANGRVATYSIGAPVSSDYPVWAADDSLDSLGRPSFTLNTPVGSAPVRLEVVGRHSIYNALAAASVGLLSGMGLDQVVRALCVARPRSRWRMEISELPGGMTLINDAYNANPDSMRAALDAVVPMAAGGRRVVAVLGDMLELGEASVVEHQALGELARARGVDELVAVGQFRAELAAGFGVAKCAEDAAAATKVVLGILEPGDVVLIKASRGLGLETVAEAILFNTKNGENS